MTKIIKKVQSREIELIEVDNAGDLHVLFRAETYDMMLHEQIGTRGLLETLLVPRPDRKHNILLMAGTYTLKVGEFREIVRSEDGDC